MTEIWTRWFRIEIHYANDKVDAQLGCKRSLILIKFRKLLSSVSTMRLLMLALFMWFRKVSDDGPQGQPKWDT